jgi:cell division protein FtsI/penicillin-binding protein 2
MRSALEKIVQKGGTGVRASVPGFRVAGKTGTAEKHNPLGGYFKGKKITTFAGMMPAQDPAFVCVVVVDEPNPTAEVVKPQGGNVSAPIFGKIAARVASHMNLQPTEPVTTPLAATNR